MDIARCGAVRKATWVPLLIHVCLLCERVRVTGCSERDTHVCHFPILFSDVWSWEVVVGSRRNLPISWILVVNKKRNCFKHHKWIYLPALATRVPFLMHIANLHLRHMPWILVFRYHFPMRCQLLYVSASKLQDVHGGNVVRMCAISQFSFLTRGLNKSLLVLADTNPS
jgi:hypothetical protein